MLRGYQPALTARQASAMDHGMTREHNTTSAVDITQLRLRDAHAFAPILAAYVQSLKRGAPRRPDEFYAETLLQDRSAEIIGARIDGQLVGFALFFDLPDPVTGARSGQVDHLFVAHEFRNLGIARALIDTLIDDADNRGWSRIVLIAPQQPDDGRKLYEKLAAKAGFSAYELKIHQR